LDQLVEVLRAVCAHVVSQTDLSAPDEVIASLVLVVDHDHFFQCAQVGHSAHFVNCLVATCDQMLACHDDHDDLLWLEPSLV
jgi:hypothetical protein